MIDIEFKRGYPNENEYKVTISDNFKYLIKDYDDLYIKFSNLNNTEGWETPANPNNWVIWQGGGCLRYNVELYSKTKGTIFKRIYDSLYDGDELEKAFKLFCQLNKNTKGIVVGSHDGTFGHWVQPVLDNITECLIIEGSEKQFNSLSELYGNFNNCTIINEIVTTDGKDVEWTTYDNGFTDSVISEVPKKFINKDKEHTLKTQKRKTIELNVLIENYSYENYDWLHTDVEGYDADLIMSLKYLPKLIIFENMHIKENNKYHMINSFLFKKGFTLIDYYGDTLAVR